MNKKLKSAICAGVFLFSSSVYALQIQIEAVETEFFDPINFSNSPEFGQTISGFLTINTVLPTFSSSIGAAYNNAASLTLTTTGSQGELTVTSNMIDLSIGIPPDANSFQVSDRTDLGIDSITTNNLGLNINSVSWILSGSTGTVQDLSLSPTLDLNKSLDFSNPNQRPTRFNDLSIAGPNINGRFVVTKFGNSVLSIPGITIPTAPTNPPTNPVSAPGVLGLMVLGLVSLFGFVGRRQNRLS